jgi:predicted kinase
MKKLVILIGNIGSGKSTLAKEYAKKGYVIICRDALRYMIGGGDYIFNLELEPAIIDSAIDITLDFMNLGVDIVIDEVNVSKKYRLSYLALAKEHGYNTIAVVLPRLSKEESVDRRMIKSHGVQNTREIWEQVWDKFNKRYEYPSKEEGFYSILDKGDII